MGATLPYITYFERFGDVKVILSTSRVVDTTLDLLVIPEDLIYQLHDILTKR